MKREISLKRIHIGNDYTIRIWESKRVKKGIKVRLSLFINELYGQYGIYGTWFRY